jgi:hypothetical protein
MSGASATGVDLDTVARPDGDEMRTTDGRSGSYAFSAWRELFDRADEAIGSAAEPARVRTGPYAVSELPVLETVDG